MKKIYQHWIKFFTFVAFSLKVVTAITNGHRVLGEKRYMVYFLAAPPLEFSAWTCGGVIITKDYVLTSASCIQNVPHAYVINGYNRYVNAEQMEKDECIMQKRKKVINFCHPKSYDGTKVFNNDFVWSLGDICVAQVDTPFAFNDRSYYDVCSYPPAYIGVNFYSHFDGGGIDVVNLGWGHAQYYRPEGEFLDMNEEFLRFSSGTTTNITDCQARNKAAIDKISISNHFKKFFICVEEPGNLDENGDIINENTQFFDTCNDTYDPLSIGRKGVDKKNCMEVLRARINYTSEHVGGFCQNDHGGPLVAWIGGHETVIGIASLFSVSDDMRCRPPYLYTATASINKLLACYIWSNFTSSRRRQMYCDDVITEMDYTQQNVAWSDERTIS
ncbi:uncharacterized protein LOC135083833 isoform X2 [Ostrinia nubilalis]